ncbi:MAG: galactose ABC transporter substrate-binding protein, partial [Hungatella sp.]
MRKQKIQIWIGQMLLLSLTVVLLAGCGKDTAQEGKEKKSIRIGVSLYRGDDTFISNLRTVLEEKAKTYEQNGTIKVNMDIVDAKGSQSTQNDQVERFISVGCDVLCVNIVDRSDASTIIDKAMTAEIPVVFFNRQPVEEDMNRWEDLYYVGADAKESAVLQGNLIVDAYRKDPSIFDLNGDGVVRYVLLEGETSHQDALIRTEWSIQTLKNGGVPLEKVTGGIANWERSQASALMEQWLNTYPNEIELVISNNDDMALGAIDALERMQVTGIKLVGIDATIPGMEALERGTLFGTVASDKDSYAGTIFEITAAKALGKPVESVVQL